MSLRSFAMFVLAASLCVVPCTRAKVFARCELAKALRDMGVETASLGDWVCLAEAESSRNTKKTHVNSNDSTDYGIFQINSNWWCDNGTNGHNACQVKCSELLGDNITKSVACAKLILKQQGLNACIGSFASIIHIGIILIVISGIIIISVVIIGVISQIIVGIIISVIICMIIRSVKVARWFMCYLKTTNELS
ncbi:lysozyme C-1/C-2-like [Callorhinchus milii]|uniref:lysozyme C-1/C-2-like n=1 Tax=Callorhinchus milii TaxID=7868 RepID=UPI001C3FE4E2|nr:lysozyme C-1/C-2-like [Callorhinchus milii]